MCQRSLAIAGIRTPIYNPTHLEEEGKDELRITITGQYGELLGFDARRVGALTQVKIIFQRCAAIVCWTV
jgi:hypothetical protein